MAPWYRMPQGKEAARAAALAEVCQTVRSLTCAATLLARSTEPVADDTIIRSMRALLRQAERSLSRLPSRTDP